jgi:hypothetical protein
MFRSDGVVVLQSKDFCRTRMLRRERNEIKNIAEIPMEQTDESE